jgi:hypothetical protein
MWNGTHIFWITASTFSVCGLCDSKNARFNIQKENIFLCNESAELSK